MDELKDTLKQWTEKLDTPVVIIIDELDRCRPDFAVKTLEVLKHFFNIPGFVFVLALDEKQLEASVKCLYGMENFDGYKRKFINNSFLLPPPDKVKFTEYLYAKSGIADTIKQIEENQKDLVFKIRYDRYKATIDRQFLGINNSETIAEIDAYNKNQTTASIIKRYFAAYSIWFKFTLRQMEQVFDRLMLFTKSIAAEGVLFSPDLAVLLVCLHEFDLKIYTMLRNEKNRQSYLKSLAKECPLDIKLYLQPLELNGQMNVDETINFIKQNPRFKLSLQYHKLIGMR